MKAILFIFIALLAFNLKAAYLENVPVTIKQPDGKTLKCYISGDEFHQRLHDSQNYTILKNKNGFYVYAVKQGNDMVPSDFIVGECDPSKLQLDKGIDLSENKILEKRNAFYQQMRIKSQNKNLKSLKSFSQINNIVIFIRFSDETEFSENSSYYDSTFNSTLQAANSMKSYYQEMSYHQLDITSYLFPSSTSTVLSYQDPNPRAYYQPYDSITNPDGYVDYSEREFREQSLLANAVNEVSSGIPTDLEVDMNGDGYVDNICFIVRGNVDVWAELLWPHRWALFDYTAYINGKQVWDFNLQLEAFFYDPTRGVGVLNHEMFHTLGAPDLYHYSTDYRNFRAVGYWDIMDRSLNPSESMLMYMKYLYAGWISEIPEITDPGIYTLFPSTEPNNNCYKIASSNPSEYFVLEYRKRDGVYESSIKSEGLLIYRINTVSEGYGNSDYPNTPDEIYVYRPDGIDTTTGLIDSATFSLNSGRILFNSTSNPWCFLSDNISSGDISISQVSTTDTTISFCFNCFSVINTEDNEKFRIFPNPVKDDIYIGLSDLTFASYKIYNLLGELIEEDRITGNRINASHLLNGIYSLEICSNNSFFTQKIIKN